jgi:hypothetical protein
MTAVVFPPMGSVKCEYRSGYVREYLTHRISGASRRCVIVVSVTLQGERCGGVPGEGLEIPYGLAALSEERQAAVPEVVEADGGEASPLQKRFVVAVHDVLSVHRRALPGCEHEVAVLVQRTSPQLLL